MKTEDTPQPATPVQTTPYSSWGSQIPIDPALQQQSHQPTPTPTPYTHYQAYQHYPQASYGAHPHYQQYIPPVPQQSQQQPQQPAQSTPAPRQAPQASAVDTADIATLNDALGSAGVDLRAEEESLQRSYDQHQTYRPYEDRTRKQPPKPNFNTEYLSQTIRAIASKHRISKISDDSLNYLALSLRFRLQELIESMVAASAHRTDTQFDRPASLYDDGNAMWSILVRNDVGKQLSVLERVEREEEMKVRRERKERVEMAAQHAAALAAQASGGGVGGAIGGASSQAGGDGSFEDDGFGGPPKKKKKKEGPGVTARNMSEDVRKKMSNAVASQAAGIGGKYSWMNAAAAAATPAPKAKAPAASGTPSATGSGTTSLTTTTPATTTAPAQSASAPGGSWAKPYVSTTKSTTLAAGAAGSEAEEDTRRLIIMRDALFVIEKERGHGGGRGSARGWV
ncbi:hypothetical protein JAAARDRAFT_194062 [Jaapia argillacea MUCL 33604]|uniref:Transcription initiation factor TFIID subunit 4 n=1 Tax=Jaapia argillacea MUCL 33604 TaxID=933084 RepID=A0A067PSR4_9AGAM|nr:hypothetical protein JAAARDRAFT_194062 [Jaapia argillacea MUCL 33604]